MPKGNIYAGRNSVHRWYTELARERSEPGSGGLALKAVWRGPGPALDLDMYVLKSLVSKSIGLMFEQRRLDGRGYCSRKRAVLLHALSRKVIFTSLAGSVFCLNGYGTR